MTEDDVPTESEKEAEVTEIEESAYDVVRPSATMPSLLTGKDTLDESIRYLKLYERPYQKERMLSVKLDNFMVYDNNIYARKESPDDDIIFHLAPGFYYNFGTPYANQVSAFYEADQYIYVKTKKESHLAQAVGLDLKLFQNNRLKFFFKDTLRRTMSPATSETTQYIDRLPNKATTTISYAVGPKLNLDAEHEQFLEHYISNSRKEYSYFKQAAGPKLYWLFSPKTALFGEYKMGTITYYEGRHYNSTFYNGFIGITGNPTPKLEVSAKTGWHARHYYNTWLGNVDGWVDCPVLEGIATWKQNDGLMFELIASHQIDESVYANNAYYYATNLWLSATKKLLLNLDITVSGLYINNQYDHETRGGFPADGIRRRHDNLFGLNTRFDYMIKKWFFIYGGYEYRYRSTNFRNMDYKRTQLYFGGRIQI